MATTAPRKPTTTTTTTRTRKPAAAKAPQDHKPKSEKPIVKPVEGGREVTFQGITVTVVDAALDDFEILELISEAEVTQNPAVLPDLLKRLVGAKGFRTVMDGLRNDEGRVPVRTAINFINNLLGALNPNS